MRSFILCCTLLALSVNSWGSSQVRKINDSLVRDLPCDQITVDRIYQAIRTTAFTAFYHLPATNWSFHSGGPVLAACWGLSSVQRKLFYLTRYDQTQTLSNEELRKNVLNMIRGNEIAANQGNGRARPQEYLLRSYQVFSVPEASMMMSIIRGKPGLFDLLNQGYKTKIGAEIVDRSLKLDIQRAEVLRFFRAGNLSMVSKNKMDRTAAENEQTMKILEKNLNSNKLTMVLLRFGLTNMHVVLAKYFYKKDDGSTVIGVYDSNLPYVDSAIQYDPKTKTFVAFNIGDRLGVEAPDKPVGAFVVDEQERTPLEKAMVVYYRDLCEK